VRIAVIDSNPQQLQPVKALLKGYIIAGAVLIGIALLWLAVLTVLLLR
jgi:hypothetical protein